MSFLPTYHKRNLATIAELGDKTQVQVMKFYQYAVSQGVDILIYDGKRTEAEQRANVAKGASQTMRSYHLVGQAIDFVPVVSGGKADWGKYHLAGIKKIVAYAKASCSLTWGGDWTGFVDKPHLQYDKIGYGKDTFRNKPVSFTAKTATAASAKSYLSNGDRGTAVKELQVLLTKAGFKLVADGIFGAGTEKAVKAFQAKYKLAVDGLAGKSTMAKLKAVTSEPEIKVLGSIKMVNLNNFTYIYAKPSDKSARVGTAKVNSTLLISGSVPGFYEVIHNGKRAYVKAKYAKRV
jgi:peptidoglycan LD-endopeptidase CwlK